MKITIRNESEKTIEIFTMKGSIHEYIYTIEPNNYLDIPKEIFHTVYIPKCSMKVVNGVIKIKS